MKIQWSLKNLTANVVSTSYSSWTWYSPLILWFLLHWKAFQYNPDTSIHLTLLMSVRLKSKEGST